MFFQIFFLLALHACHLNSVKISNEVQRQYPMEVNNAIKLYLNKKYLQVVRLANDTIDSKTIVDRPTKKPIEQVLEALEKIQENDKQAAINFVNDYLGEPGSEILKTGPTDWSNSPSFLTLLKSNELKKFGKALNDIWLDLYRKVDDRIFSKGFVTSHLPMVHPFVVPGGRFIEMYYWDTYWTIEGLLVCDMHKTVRMILENFINFINQYGHIPNGSRVYYLNRSQPPYFAQMVMAYLYYSLESSLVSDVEKAEIKSFVLNSALNAIEAEYKFWMKEKVVKIMRNDQEYTFNLFKVNTDEPRPESYNEDVETASHFSDEADKAKIYANKASAAESGYDFCSRWNRNPYELDTIQTTNIIPVDLNALMYKMECVLVELYTLKDDSEKSEVYRKYSQDRKKAINDVLWSERMNYWADFDMGQNKLNDEHFFVFGLSPLWFGINAPNKTANEVIDANAGYFLKFNGGIPVSFINSSEQWDMPNVWAPNQHSVIMMIYKYDKNLSLKVARNFFNSVYQGWKKSNVFYEKYDAVHPGERGLGGEYEVQSGFGWTNGVILNLLQVFKDELIN